MNALLTVNGRQTEANLPCSLEEFIRIRGLHPGSVVVELNGAALSPSEFSSREIQILKDVNLMNTAVVNSEFKDEVSNEFVYSSSAKIDLVSQD